MRSLLVLLVIVLGYYSLSCQPLPGRKAGADKAQFVRGVYGNPQALLTKGHSFDSLGINAVFIHSGSLDAAIFRAASQENVRVFVEFPTLNGKDYLTTHPEAWPIDERGERSPQADWFMGICPTNPEFRDYRLKQLRSILTEFPVAGVWLDYVHWHAQFETPAPILPETCFCERCTGLFEQDMNVRVPAAPISQRAAWILANADSPWRLWRTRVLTGWVSDMKLVVNELRPQALLGIYYCPWYPSDFGGALYKNMGLDMKQLAGVVDVFSPMLYHQMMGRPVTWVNEYTEWLGGLSDKGQKPLIWPIVQAHDKPGVVTTEEFQQVMSNGMRSPATGIMMFTVHSLAENPAKLEVMKKLYKK